MVNSYRPLKEKYEELQRKYDGMVKKVESLESDKTLTEDKIPAFLFRDTATNDEIYEYLKKNPQYSEYIYMNTILGIKNL